MDGLIRLRRGLDLCSAAVHDACMFFFFALELTALKPWLVSVSLSVSALSKGHAYQSDTGHGVTGNNFNLTARCKHLKLGRKNSSVSRT